MSKENVETMRQMLEAFDGTALPAWPSSTRTTSLFERRLAGTR
jgi:hypothetical protein